MSNFKIVVGLQYGDEGKGKIVDYLSHDADYCIRFQGGSNAGHTIVVDDETYKLRLTPSGILRDQTVALLGAGMAIDFEVLEKEINFLSEKNFYNGDNLFIDGNALIVLPSHKRIDSYLEEKTNNRIGTTKKGIGIAYEDRAKRIALTTKDIIRYNPESEYWKDRIKLIGYHHSLYLPETSEYIEKEIAIELERLRKWSDLIFYKMGTFISHQISNNAKILVEGAQGTLLDPIHGTYPYCTSSSTLATSVSASIGCPVPNDAEIIGVAKAYCTRVGPGPFPGEESEELSKKLRETGSEYGVVTGRPRRCGWIHIPDLISACNLNNTTALAITKVDILDEFEEVKIKMTSIHDKTFRVFQGWKNSKNKTSYKDLEPELKEYLRFLQISTKTPIKLISTGPKRNEVVCDTPCEAGA